MPQQDRLLQDRVKDLESLPAHSPRRPLVVASGVAALLVAGLLWLAINSGSPLSIGLVVLVGVMTAGLALFGEVFLRWRDALIRNHVELAVRRLAEFEESGDGVLILNDTGQIEAANAAAEQIFGQSRQSLGRVPVTDVLPLAVSAGEPGFISRLEAEVGPLVSASMRETAARRPDGGETPVDVTIRSLWMADGQYVGVYVRDISDRKRIERLKDEFVSTVSHELRTPLTSIAGSLGLLAGGAMGEALPEGPTRLIGIAHANCQRLIRLINDMLDIEKIESGKMKFEMVPLTLQDAAERSIDAVRGVGDQLNVGLDLKVEDDDVAVRGDVDRLVQVGANLISNALKFSKAGDRVSVTVSRQGRLARLSVKDQGPGIPEEFRSRIFTKFAQADSSDTRQKGGTGLGLVIAREIVERHGGRLWFESVPGAGATFHVDLPVADEFEPAQGGGVRLLVCEDDPDIAEVLRRTLELDGFSVDVVRSAAETLAALSVQHSYRALLLDLVLPDGNGLDLIHMLKSRPSADGLPIVVVSAQADAGRRSAGGHALNVVDWMEKPVDIARLRRAVAAALAKTAPTRRPTILHVDDDHDILRVTAAALAPCGEVVSVESLGAARAFMTARTPDLVILDLELGDGSGLELLAELNDADGSPIPVLIFSAHDTDHLVVNRVQEVMTKSRTSLAALADAVRRLVDPAPSRAEPRRKAS